MSEKNFNIAGPESWKGTPPMDQRIYSDPQPMTNLRNLAGRLMTDLRPDANSNKIFEELLDAKELDHIHTIRQLSAGMRDTIFGVTEITLRDSEADRKSGIS